MQENVFESVCKMATIMSMSRCINAFIEHAIA